MSRFLVLSVLLLAFPASAQDCRIRLDEADIDLHGWLRAFYSCPSLGRSFVMDYNVQRSVPSYANFVYDRKNYASVLKEILGPLGLRLVQGKWVDAVVVMPPPSREPVAFPPPPPAPLMGANGERGAAAGSSGVEGDSSAAALSLSSSLPAVDSSAVRPARRFRAKASGLLRSSARSLGFSYSELVASASSDGVSRLWEVSARASDSLASLDFARIVDFSAWDTARVVFGGEVRRPDATVNYENGSALTQYSSVFDGLTVDLKGDRWFFLWRREGSILEVPGSVGSCASGSSRVSFDSAVGVPFLSGVPFLRYFFSHVRKYDDELLIAVCLEEVLGDE